jgi:hypothetical protein
MGSVGPSKRSADGLPEGSPPGKSSGTPPSQKSAQKPQQKLQTIDFNLNSGTGKDCSFSGVIFPKNGTVVLVGVVDGDMCVVVAHPPQAKRLLRDLNLLGVEPGMLLTITDVSEVAKADVWNFEKPRYNRVFTYTPTATISGAAHGAVFNITKVSPPPAPDLQPRQHDALSLPRDTARIPSPQPARSAGQVSRPGHHPAPTNQHDRRRPDTMPPCAALPAGRQAVL